MSGRRVLAACAVVAAFASCRALAGIEDLRVDGGSEAGSVGDSGVDGASGEGSAADAGRAACLNDCNRDAGDVLAASFYGGPDSGIRNCICDYCTNECERFCSTGMPHVASCDDCAERLLVPADGPCHGLECMTADCYALADCLANCPPQ